MILSDTEILKEIYNGNIEITPFKQECLGSNSYDVHLGGKLGIYKPKILDAKKHNDIHLFDIKDEGFLLEPNTLYLGTTMEYTETLKHVPFIEGKSSTGRLGISIHATAGKGDVGFMGYWTLEITVVEPVIVYSGMPIGQLIYFETKGECFIPYHMKDSAKYSNQPNIPVESMMWKNKF
jgi:dCTP deaminase